MKVKSILFAIFVIAEAVLYGIIFSPLPNSYIYCYISIVLCFLFSFVLFQKNKAWLLVCLALFFTLTADTFLILLQGKHKAVAMVAFNVTQILYAVKIGFESKKIVNIASLVARTALIVFAELLAFVFLNLEFDVLVFVTMPYFVNLLFNAAFVFPTKRLNWLFAVGLILFVLCDINVGLPYIYDLFILSENNILYRYLQIPFNFIWFFYLPSQVCIVASLLGNTKKSKSFPCVAPTSTRDGEGKL